MNYSYQISRISTLSQNLFSLTVKRASNSNPTVETNEKSAVHLEEKKASPQKRGGKHNKSYDI